jgi:hypothetical protein
MSKKIDREHADDSEKHGRTFPAIASVFPGTVTGFVLAGEISFVFTTSVVDTVPGWLGRRVR